jgi:DNA-binding response OmpR family regulator
MIATLGTPAFLILVVDDEATMRRSLADILRLEGYRVQMAESGETAVQRLQSEVYDLILLDLKMPGMDGVEVLRQAVKIAPETQVILLTAHGSLESAIEALRLGAHDYLLKPSSPEVILESVAKALQARTEFIQREELLSKLEESVLALREGKDNEPSEKSNIDDVIIGNGISIDFNRRIIQNDQLQVNLTSAECKLLNILLENRSRIFTHQELVARVQGYEAAREEAPQVLRPLVSRLRQKIAKFPGSQKWIVTIRGKGYGFEQEELRQR